MAEYYTIKRIDRMMTMFKKLSYKWELYRMKRFIRKHRKGE